MLLFITIDSNLSSLGHSQMHKPLLPCPVVVHPLQVLRRPLGESEMGMWPCSSVGTKGTWTKGNTGRMEGTSNEDDGTSTRSCNVDGTWTWTRNGRRSDGTWSRNSSNGT